MTAEDFQGGPYVVLFDGTGIVDWAISWQQRGRWTHAAIVYDGMVYEARFLQGFIKRRWRTNGYPDKAWTVRVPVVPFTEEERAAGVAWLEKQVGKKYDWKQVFRFVTRRRLRHDTRGEWFCSESVSAHFDTVGRPLFANTDPEDVTPQLLDRTRELVTKHTQHRLL